MFRNYFKIAFRNLFKHRASTLINIMGLALGMVCCLLILLWVQDELSYDRFHTRQDHLYELINKYDSYWSTTSPLSLSTTLVKDFPEIEKATRYINRNILTKHENTSYYESAGFVDLDFLDMFSFQMISGDPASALNTAESVILTKTTARKYFKDADPIGKTLLMNNNQNMVVTGVLQDVPQNSSMQFDMLVSIKNLGEDYISTWYWETQAFVLLHDNVSVPDLCEKIAGTAMKYDNRNTNVAIINSMRPIKHMHLYDPNGLGTILYIYIFSAVALIVLVVACINFITLVTATATLRGKEVGMRKVVGADSKHIMLQFYSETFMLSLFSLAVALVVARLLLPGFNLLANKQLILGLQNPTLLLGSLSIILITTVFAGSYPALMLSSFHPSKILKESPAAGLKKSTVRWALIVFQFAVSMILIIMTMTMSKQMSYIQNKNLGFNREQVISLPMNDNVRSQFESLKNQWLLYPNITHVTSATAGPYAIGSVNPVYWQGHGPENYQNMNYISLNYDYIETFEMEMAAGRGFSKEFSTDPQNYIVNEAAVEFMKMDDPVGKMFSIWENEGRIIGVVKDFHSTSLHNTIPPLVMTFYQFVPHNQIFIRIQPNNIKSTLSEIEKIWTVNMPDMPFQYEFLDDVFRRQYLNEEKIETLFQYFSALAIFISCMGLFGLAAFIAQRRTKEIGVRKIIGASVSDIIVLMIRDFAKWLMLAVGIAVPVGWYAMNSWLSNFAYKINISWWMFVLSGLIVFAIAVFTVSWQAVRAATANPVESLRYE